MRLIAQRLRSTSLRSTSLTAASLVAAGLLAVAGGPALAQKRGGTITIPHIDTPPSPSIQEEGTASVMIPFMPVFNNLVLFDQHEPRHSIETIRPELATAWQWGEDGKTLTFTLRQGVKWHNGQAFTTADVKCTWDMVSGLTPGKMRKSPRQAWFTNLESISTNGLESISTNGDHEVTFHLKRPQPSFIALLASGWSPVYACHVPANAMKTHPIGTGPFRFAEYRMNESMRLERNPDYWKPSLPYLDAIEYKIVPNRATRMLGFVSGNFDMTYPTDVSVSLLHDINRQDPNAICVLRRTNVDTNLIINRGAPPFDNADLRKALALAIDRKSFNDILNEGQGRIGAAMLPPPEGVWGMPPEELEKLTGYGSDVAANRAEAQAIMKKLGYGPDNMLKTKIFPRNIPTFRDPALIMNDQLKQIYIDADLDVVDTPQFYARVFKKDYAIGVNQTGSALDDPDQNFYENYACGSLRNYTAYCNKTLQADFDKQSMETDFQKRKAMVWDIERKLADDVVRPIIFHDVAAACWHPYVKNMTIMVNSIYNGWRWEDVWLDK